MSNISDDDEGHIERMKDIKKSEEMITRAREAGDDYLAGRLERRKKGEELDDAILRAREAGNDDLAARLEKKLDDIDKYDEQLWFQDLRNRKDPILNPDVVYFIKIGNAIKIGHTRDMVGRLASLRAGTNETGRAPGPPPQCPIPGSRKRRTLFIDLDSPPIVATTFW